MLPLYQSASAGPSHLKRPRCALGSHAKGRASSTDAQNIVEDTTDFVRGTAGVGFRVAHAGARTGFAKEARLSLALLVAKAPSTNGHQVGAHGTGIRHSGRVPANLIATAAAGVGVRIAGTDAGSDGCEDGVPEAKLGGALGVVGAVGADRQR